MKKKIVMIDDDPDFRYAIITFLDNAGYNCIEANSARNGLKLVFNENPALIILDVMMEDISSGFRFVKEQLKIENSRSEVHIPILVLTSIQKITNLNFQKRLTDILPQGDRFLDKPVDFKILLKHVNEMIKKS